VRSRTVGLLAVVALLIASCGGGSVEGSGVSDGIGVHGGWTIDVINPDGSLDQHVEFENAITEDGRNVLALILLDTPGINPAISDVLLMGANDSIFRGGTPCSRLYPTLVGMPPEFVSNACSLALDGEFSTDIGDAPEYPIILAGSFTAETDGTIDIVETIVSGGAFTRKLGAPLPVSVEAGQIVQVEVLITFE